MGKLQNNMSSGNDETASFPDTIKAMSHDDSDEGPEPDYLKQIYGGRNNKGTGKVLIGDKRSTITRFFKVGEP